MWIYEALTRLGTGVRLVFQVTCITDDMRKMAARWMMSITPAIMKDIGTDTWRILPARALPQAGPVIIPSRTTNGGGSAYERAMAYMIRGRGYDGTRWGSVKQAARQCATYMQSSLLRRMTGRSDRAASLVT